MARRQQKRLPVPKIFPVETVVAAAVEVVQARGYQSEAPLNSKTFQPQTPPTVKFVLAKLKEPSWQPRTDGIVAKTIITHYKNPDLASNAKDSKEKEFLFKVKEILEVGTVSETMLPYLVILPHLFKDELEKVTKEQAFTEKYKSSTYIGTIGQEHNFLVKRIVDENPKKPSGLYLDDAVFKTKNGDLVLVDSYLEKFESSDWECFLISGKIYGFSTFTGVKYTVIEDVHMVQEIGIGTPE